MDYREAQQYLDSFVDYEKIPGIGFASADYSLDHVEELLRRLDNPQLVPKVVHIAGSKGKGSVAAMIASVLSAAGYRTGLYTSPHLHGLMERIRIDGRPASEQEFADLVAQLRPHLDELQNDSGYRPLTYFEALTVLAFVYFTRQEVDVLVCEVGLGGRLDATNLVRPQVVVITPISLEHTQVLGSTLSQIAREKGGVIKTGSMVVSGPQPEEAAQVLREICSAREAGLTEVGKDVHWTRTGKDLERQSFRVFAGDETYELAMPLLGDYQLENAATAVAALRALDSTGVPVGREAIATGLARVEWPGRFQVVRRAPLVLLDGAHTVASVERLVESIRSCLTYGRMFLVVGLSCDKDIPGIVKELVPLSPRVVATRSSHPRAAPPEALAREFRAQGLAASGAPDVGKALSETLRVAAPDDLICVTGSLFLVGEALDYLARSDSQQETPAPPEGGR